MITYVTNLLKGNLKDINIISATSMDIHIYTYKYYQRYMEKINQVLFKMIRLKQRIKKIKTKNKQI